MSIRPIAKRIASEESGLTLIELLVVMIISIVTTIALFTFQDVALRQTSKVFARVDATQQARIAIEQIESRLHSSCVAAGVTPILSGSDDSNLSFVSEYGSAATLTPDKHTISLSAGKLVDTTYLATGGTAPNWTFSSTEATSPPPTTILEVTAAPPGKSAFTYYGYGIAKDSSGNSYLDAAGTPYVMLLDGTSTLPTGVTTSSGAAVAAGTIPANSPSPLTTPLSTDAAAGAAAVAINLVVNPAGELGTNVNNSEAPVTVSDSVVLRITPVPSDNNQTIPPPCQ